MTLWNWNRRGRLHCEHLPARSKQIWNAEILCGISQIIDAKPLRAINAAILRMAEDRGGKCYRFYHHCPSSRKEGARRLRATPPFSFSGNACDDDGDGGNGDDGGDRRA